MNTSFGLDFGTTNSVLSVASSDKVEVIDIDPTSESPKTLRSVIFFDEEGHICVGQDAVDQYLTHKGSWGRLLQSIKTHLPDKSFVEACVYGKWIYVEELAAILLREIKRRGEMRVGHAVDSVVLGRPVLFSEDKERDALAEKRLRSAAMLAGFRNVEFLFEPVAATLAYESTLPIGKEQLVLMGDLGGGTSDFAVMRLCGGRSRKGERGKNAILSVGGVPIGGDSFDALIMKHKLRKYFGEGVRHKGMRGQSLEMPISLINLVCNWRISAQMKTRRIIADIREIKQTADDKVALQNLETMVSENLSYLLFRAIESAKCTLSRQEDACILFREKDINIDEAISRDEFSGLAFDNIVRIEACIERTLNEAGVRMQDVDRVLLTGGTSFIPVVRNIFARKFGNEKIHSIDAFTSVGYGLGSYAQDL